MVIAQSKRRRLIGILSVTCLLATAAATVVPAAPLDEQTCDQLKREIVQLEGLGARDNLAKGASWGKANLRGAQLEQVKKLIEMDEVVAFRCPKPKPKVEPAVQAKVKQPPKGAPKVRAAEGGPAQDIIKPKPKPRPKPAPVAADGASGQAPAPTAAAPPKPKPRPPQQPKAPDVYVPPKAPPG